MSLPHLDLVGIGTNLACQSGVAPDQVNMEELSRVVTDVEAATGAALSVVSGGNSASLGWALRADSVGRVNELRLGEAILLGVDPLTRMPLAGLRTDAFTVVGEVIEVQTKPSQPWGRRAQAAFGAPPALRGSGLTRQGIVALGRQDVDPHGLTPPDGITVLGTSSDHLVLDLGDHPARVGDELGFGVDYGCLLSAATSPFVAVVETLKTRTDAGVLSRRLVSRTVRGIWVPCADDLGFLDFPGRVCSRSPGEELLMHRRRAVRPLRGRAVLGAAVVLATAAASLALTVTSASADQADLVLVSDTTTGEERLNDARWRGATPDGTHVFFSTRDRLVAADDDSSEDVYERFGGAVTLVSAGQINGDQPFEASFGGVSADGSRVWFSTLERLTTDDDDDSDDLYERSGGQTTLVSTGEVDGPEPMGVDFFGASADGSRVFFYTAESLVDDDTDSAIDVYERAEGTTRLITGLAGTTGPSDVQGGRVSTDGSRVYFSTSDALVTADEDAERDIYLREGGALTLVTLGPTGGNGPFFTFQTRMTPDGSHLVFETRESLVAADVDTADDYYLWSPGGQPVLVTGGTADIQVGTIAMSDDGEHIYFSTREGLVTADTDGLPDVYRYTGTSLQLITATGGDVRHRRELHRHPTRVQRRGTRRAGDRSVTDGRRHRRGRRHLPGRFQLGGPGQSRAGDRRPLPRGLLPGRPPGLLRHLRPGAAHRRGPGLRRLRVVQRHDHARQRWFDRRRGRRPPRQHRRSAPPASRPWSG